MKKLHLSLVLGCLLLLSFLSCSEGTGKEFTHEFNRDEIAFVFLQLREDVIELDSFGESVLVRAVLDEIKSANTKMGYAPFEKKMASTLMSQDDKMVHIIAIRNFDNLSAARDYAHALDKELKDIKYGPIPEPFAISQSNYKQCMADKDFTSYYTSYKRSLKD